MLRGFAKSAISHATTSLGFRAMLYHRPGRRNSPRNRQIDGTDDTDAETACRPRDDSPTGSFKDGNLYRGLTHDTHYRRSLQRKHPEREMTNPPGLVIVGFVRLGNQEENQSSPRKTRHLRIFQKER